MRWVLGAAALFVLSGWDGIAAGLEVSSPDSSEYVSRQLVVMSENIYLGADVVPTALATMTGCPGAIISKVSQLWRDVQETSFPERADVLARQIIAAKADLVGLQEVMLFRTGRPDSLWGNRTQAEHVELDFLAVLLERLAAAGAPYTPVAVTVLADLELPGYIASPGSCCQRVLRDVRLTDHVVILARSDLLETEMQIGNVQGKRFTTRPAIPVGLSGRVLLIYRGWNSVDVTWGDTKFRFVNICLETHPFPRIQACQVRELSRGPLCTSLPLILAGDSNSDANGVYSCAYRMLIGNGLHDAWKQTHPGQPGYTYGNRPDLRNPVAMSYHPMSCHPFRFDQMLYRGPFRATEMKRVGVDPADRTVTGMWPSDHAGIVATIELTPQPPPAPGGRGG